MKKIEEMTALERYVNLSGLTDLNFWKLQDEDEDVFFKIIYRELKENGSVSFPYHVSEGTSYDILICEKYKQLGYPNSGGNTANSIFVAIQLFGSCFHFNINGKNKIYPSYLMEKLKLQELEATGMSRLINSLRELNVLNFNFEEFFEELEKDYDLLGVIFREGDIVENEAFRDIVVLKNGVMTTERSKDDQPLKVHKNLKVIGNIRDNPEILEEIRKKQKEQTGKILNEQS